MKRVNLKWLSTFAAMAVVMEVFSAPTPLPEHPRPDWERAQWMNLNGVWRFGFGDKPECLDREIVVPFGWGTPLSGVETGRTETKGFYRRELTVPESWRGRRIFVVVGASDWETRLWIDGIYLGCHQGGYVPFEFEITPFVKFGERQILDVAAMDDIGCREGGVKRDGRLYGKQGYGDVRGIWQTVYLEARSGNYLEHVHFLPDLQRGGVTVKAQLAMPVRDVAGAKLTVAFDRRDRDGDFAIAFRPGEMAGEAFIPLQSPRLWQLDDPYLYEVVATLREGSGEDRVKTYFGMREIGVGKMPGTGHPYITLNGKPHYLRLCLDQSYNPGGFYTFPSDGFMRREIEIAKSIGLDGIRVHIKAEVPRKLYWADRLGCLVMADVPNAWGWPDDTFFREHDMTMREMFRRDMNHPSIFAWVLFNETWGLKNLDLAKRPDLDTLPWYLADAQGRVAKRYFEAKALDPTRLVEDNSPCYNDHVVSDINSFHGYQPGWAWEDFIRRYSETAAPGATVNYIDGFAQTGAPLINSECGNVWGYSGSTGDVDDSWDYHGMMDAFRRNMKCAGWLYTEHHDVTNEWNGYVRADRSPKDFGYGELFPGMSIADFHRDAYVLLADEIHTNLAAGARWEIPLGVSLVTDAYAGRRMALAAELRYFDGTGRLHVRQLGEVAVWTAGVWQQGRVGKCAIPVPATRACGTVNFTLSCDSEIIARNFTCFNVRSPVAADVREGRFAGGSFSLKAWPVLDGLKQCGAGSGEFNYRFSLKDVAPGAKLRFQAELSTRPLYFKDREGVDGSAVVDLDAMLGAGAKSGHANANSYPQTDGDKHPGVVQIVVGGRVIATAALPDDPADHRGILSWAAQPRDRRLRDAGTYGTLVEAEIPGEIAAAAAGEGVLTVTLRSTGGCGLAVYGPEFGRYPLGPQLIVAAPNPVEVRP